MPQAAPNSRQPEQTKSETHAQLPESFEESMLRIADFALDELQKATYQKQLFYHNRTHADAVKQRADKIFQTIVPFVEDSFKGETGQAQLKRMKQLIELSAIAHDMVQDFIPDTQPHTSRLRKSGENEAATISQLSDYISELNQQILQDNLNSAAIFTESDLQTLQEAIAATVCLYDTSDRCIYQPLLYNPEKKIPLPSLIIALADMGSLGIDGIEAYNREGSLIFLEENPDIISIFWNAETQQFLAEYETPDRGKQELYEGIRQRLLKRARFQVDFAKGRYSRFDCEVNTLPADAIQALKTEVFQYLTEETIQKIESLTPTRDETTLQELIEFFELEKYIKEMQPKLGTDVISDHDVGLPSASLTQGCHQDANGFYAKFAIAPSWSTQFPGYTGFGLSRIRSGGSAPDEPDYSRQFFSQGWKY